MAAAGKCSCISGMPAIHGRQESCGKSGALRARRLLQFAPISHHATMLANYAPILIFLVIAGGISVVLLFLGFTFGRGRKDADKLSPYECGFEAFEDSRMRFDVRYYLVAILFIIFDLEIAFLFPWAVSLDVIGRFGIAAMGIFLAVLVVGFVYEWRKGALEWD
jgi:NADH-quinone oxidoreductase subunit A